MPRHTHSLVSQSPSRRRELRRLEIDSKRHLRSPEFRQMGYHGTDEDSLPFHHSRLPKSQVGTLVFAHVHDTGIDPIDGPDGIRLHSS